MKHLHIIRSYLPEATIGFCDIPTKRLYTLEPPDKKNKPNVSCILEGTYLVKRDRTGNHQYYAVQNVPNRTFIEWHPANKVSQLAGCTAFGQKRADDNVSLVASELGLKDIMNYVGEDDFLVTYRAYNASVDNLF